MEFDETALNSFRQIINDELAYGIFLYDWAVRKEIKSHLSVRLFESSPLKETLLKLISYHIKRAETKSIVVFTEDDPALGAIATWVSTRTKLPFHSYSLKDPSALSQFITPEVCSCSLLISYSSNDIQVNEIVKVFTDKMVPIKQVISLVEERPLDSDFRKMKIEYVSVANWFSLQERIKKFKNLTPQKMSEMLQIFK